MTPSPQRSFSSSSASRAEPTGSDLRVASVTAVAAVIPATLATLLADSFMEIDEVVTVRVEAAAGLVVYRVDVPGGDLSLARRPAALVSQRLGLGLRVSEAQVMQPR
jgi:hypothetical protein